jgi:hypothetical protein
VATEVVSSAAVSANGKPEYVSRKRKVTVKEEESSSDLEDEEYERKEAELEVSHGPKSCSALDPERSFQAELQRVVRALLDHRQGKHVKKKVKHEPKPAFLPGEIIDLTI